jgi:hypothetical protein
MVGEIGESIYSRYEIKYFFLRAIIVWKRG